MMLCKECDGSIRLLRTKDYEETFTYCENCEQVEPDTYDDENEDEEYEFA